MANSHDLKDGELPKPDCPQGYTEEQINTVIFDEPAAFWSWFEGQTGGICCRHGLIVYPWDLVRFLQNKPPWD